MFALKKKMKKVRGPCDLALCALILFLFSSNFLFFSLKKIKKTNRRKQKEEMKQKNNKKGGPFVHWPYCVRSFDL